MRWLPIGHWSLVIGCLLLSRRRPRQRAAMFDVISNYFTNDWQALILVSVCLTTGVLSPIVVSSRLAFFSDAVAHSTLAGVALGLLLSLDNPLTLMVGVAIVVALIIASLRQVTTLGLDTLLGVAMAGS